MLISEQAKQFAIHAHMGQFRKSDPTCPAVAHPIAVGEMLARYGYDDAIVAAGFLHDVVEDTHYTITDIQDIFGENIASLVQTASEPDKSFPWRIRKQHTIDVIKTAPLQNKVIVAADKIDNTADLIRLIQSQGSLALNYSRLGRLISCGIYPVCITV